jgi:phosphatidylserine decarboxylase
MRSAIMKIVQQDNLNFLLTNAIPRRLMTGWMGWFSRIENPLIYHASLWVWRLFTDLDLTDAETKHFASLHQCFTRRLKAGARPIETDPAILVSPCDGIIGANGTVQDGQVLQVKGFAYSVAELLGDKAQAEIYERGCYVTLRLTSSMYHRFHALHDCHVGSVTHIPGDTWNVNPSTLNRVARLFCKNERAVLQTTLTSTGHPISLVPVAAILVAGIRLRFLDLPLRSRAQRAPHMPATVTKCDVSLHKGEEMGWFEHGSTIIIFAPAGFSLCENVQQGDRIRVGERLIRLPEAA